MSAVLNNNELFNKSGCLSQLALEHYLQDMLSAKHRKILDEHVASCPFCKDALEGLSGITAQQEPSCKDSSDIDVYDAGPKKKPASYTSEVGTHTHRINMRLRSRFGYDPDRGIHNIRRPSLRNLFIPAAASIIILIGIIAYFHYFFPEQQELALAEQKDLSLMTEDRETTEKNAETTVIAVEPKATIIGGVKNRSEESPSENDMIPSGSKVDAAHAEEISKAIVAEDIEKQEKEIVASEEEVAETESVVLDEVVIMHAAKEKAGTGVSDVNGMGVKTRAKGMQQKSEQAAEFEKNEQMPVFPGGKDSLHVFLQTYLVYPQNVIPRTDTTVIARFMVNKRGKIKNITIVKSAGEIFDNEVVRVIRLMPDWVPGRLDGKEVSLIYTLPVIFKSD